MIKKLIFVLIAILLIPFAIVFSPLRKWEATKCFDEFGADIKMDYIVSNKVLQRRQANELNHFYGGNNLLIKHTKRVVYFPPGRVSILLDNSYCLILVKNVGEAKGMMPKKSIKYKMVRDWHVFLLKAREVSPERIAP